MVAPQRYGTPEEIIAAVVRGETFASPLAIEPAPAITRAEAVAANESLIARLLSIQPPQGFTIKRCDVTSMGATTTLEFGFGNRRPVRVDFLAPVEAARSRYHVAKHWPAGAVDETEVALGYMNGAWYGDGVQDPPTRILQAVAVLLSRA